jgi:hypothetical protein
VAGGYTYNGAYSLTTAFFVYDTVADTWTSLGPLQFTHSFATLVVSCPASCPDRANAITTCSNEVCGFMCNLGYVDCDLNPANGCEVNTNSDASNCGSCGHTCSFEQYCSSGTCQKATLIYVISGDQNPTEVYNIATGQLNSSYPAHPTYYGLGNFAVTGISVNNSIYVMSNLLAQSKTYAWVFNKITQLWNPNPLASLNTPNAQFPSQIWMSGNTMIYTGYNGYEWKYDIFSNIISIDYSSPDVGTLTANIYVKYLPRTSYVYAAGVSNSNSAGFVSAGNGLIYLSEYTGTTCTNLFSVYNTTTKVKSLANVPTTICANGGAVAYGNKIYVAGGYTTGSVLTQVFQVYDIISNTWAQLPQLQFTHQSTTLVVG